LARFIMLQIASPGLTLLT